jgi:hypothetical protein
VRTLTVTAAATGTANVTVTLDGVATGVALTSGDTINQVATKIAAASYANWTASATGAVVTFAADWRGARGGTYSYAASTTGTAASFATVLSGQDFTIDDFFLQANFNGDKLDGTGSSGITFDPAKLNVFMILWAYLGTAPAALFICGTDGRWHLVHRWAMPNAMTSPNFSQPSMYVGWLVENSGNTTSITMQGASIAVGNVGAIHIGEPIVVDPVAKTGIATGANYVPILCIRAAQTYQNQVNYNVAYIDQGTIGSSSSNTALVVWVLNPATLTGAVFTSAAANSMLEVDTSATAFTGGSFVGTGTLNTAGTAVRTFGPSPIGLRRGDVLVAAVKVTTGPNYNATASIAGRET